MKKPIFLEFNSLYEAFNQYGDYNAHYNLANVDTLFNWFFNRTQIEWMFSDDQLDDPFFRITTYNTRVKINVNFEFNRD